MTFSTDQNTGGGTLSAASREMMGMRDAVLDRWEEETRKNVDGARDIQTPVLIDTLPAFYDNIAEALTPDYPRSAATSHTDVASAHGDERARMTDYGPEQVIHEYQLFKAAFARVAEERGLALSREEWAVFHDSVDRAAREAIKKFTEMHQTFRHQVAAALSHDMRGPLAAMVGGAQLVLLNPQSERNALHAQKIVDNGFRLGEMIGELLDALSFHKGAKLPLDLSEFDMLALARSVAELLEDGPTGRCEVGGESVTGHWCAGAMRRAIENLATNAAKYGDGKTIRINVAQTHGRVILTVHNSGNPISREGRSRIFEYLRREGGAAESGWGIGLPFVRSVAESHGGSVVVDSSKAAGTTFMMDMPVDCRPFV